MRIFAALAGVLLSFSALAADTKPATSESYLEGKDYTLLSEQVRPAVDPNKIEVAEVFAYTCPHCFHFEPLLDAWMEKQKPDVALTQIHTSWDPRMEPIQRGFYTAVALKIKDKTQLATFKAFHEQHNELKDAQAWADFLSGFGVSKADVLKTYDSFGVTSQIKQADSKTRGYKVTGTPTLVVDGRFRIQSGSGDGAHEKMLKIAEFLVDQVRAERAAKAK